MNIKEINFTPELKFKTSRSGGAGGQNVNKVSTKVELNFDITNSALLSDEQKSIVLEKLANRITKDGVLQLIVQTERSQLDNKEIAVQKFYELIQKSFIKQKKRKPTRPSKGSKERRLESKKRDSGIKKLRKKDW
ncbi:MAG: alternative ribosome rescue aminoacyl-tRNA hydrolase ArfB [Bacteroidia bacterium]